MGLCFFTSDLHGRIERFEKLIDLIRDEKPGGVFLGGDLMPHVMDRSWDQDDTGTHFVEGWLAPRFTALQREMGESYPRLFLILGNDDPFAFAAELEDHQQLGVWEYAHGRRIAFGEWTVVGYNCVPPTPFQLKDWERYDVSRFVDPGCVAPEDGMRTDGMADHVLRHKTIRAELQELTGEGDLDSVILLMHGPPYQTGLDRAALDGQFVDHVPLDPHVGSIAIKELIEQRQPLLSLHGHVHESTSLTGSWSEQLGASWAFNGAHQGRELPLIRFDPRCPQSATRELV